MTDASRHVLDQFMVRKSKAQKAAFRDWLCQTLRELGYDPQIEEGRSLVTSHNVVVGDLDKAEVVLTAHYDTCAVLPFPNFITPRNPVMFILYQVLIVLIMITLAVAAELLVLSLIDSLWVALLTMYAVMIFLIWWMLAGKANKHTVNDNTSGVITLLEIAQTLPEDQRGKVVFVFFDNEEKGLFGSAAFYKAHKAQMRKKLLLNFDCVSDGDHILFFPSKALRKSGAELDRLERAFPPSGGKAVKIVRRGFAIYPSDQKHFPQGVGIAALHRAPVVGYYLGRIHTGRDTVMDEANIELLRRGTLTFLGLE